MPSLKRRIVAFCSLLTLGGLLAGFCALPLSISFLKQHREMFKRVRAGMIGARFVSDKGVVLQSRGNDCGAASLKMILEARGIEYSMPDLVSELRLTPRGTSMLNLRLVAGKLGAPAKAWAIKPRDLRRIPLPAIAFVNQDHFIVIRRMVAPDVLEVDDPALGKLQWPMRAFQRAWSGETLVFDPTWTPL